MPYYSVRATPIESQWSSLYCLFHIRSPQEIHLGGSGEPGIYMQDKTINNNTLHTMSTWCDITGLQNIKCMFTPFCYCFDFLFAYWIFSHLFSFWRHPPIFGWPANNAYGPTIPWLTRHNDPPNEPAKKTSQMDPPNRPAKWTRQIVPPVCTSFGIPGRPWPAKPPPPPPPLRLRWDGEGRGVGADQAHQSIPNRYFTLLPHLQMARVYTYATYLFSIHDGRIILGNVAKYIALGEGNY